MLITPPTTAPASNPNASGLARRATVGFTTTLSADIVASGTTVPLTSVTGLSADTAVTIVIEPKTAKQEVVIGFVESSNLVNCLRGLEGTAYDHSNGATVMMISTAMDHNSLVDFLLKDHNPDGTHHPSAIVGEIKTWPSLTLPSSSWAIADGSSLLRSAYPALFAILGTTYGSADSTHFNLPDYRGRALHGYDATQTEFNSVSKTGGEKTHILLLSEMPSHTHTVNDPGHNHGTNDPGHRHNVAVGGFVQRPIVGTSDGTNGFFQGGNTLSDASGTGITNSPATTGITNNSAGSDGAHNNLGPYAVAVHMIRVLP